MPKITLRGPPPRIGKNWTSAGQELDVQNLSCLSWKSGQRPARKVPRRPDSKKVACGKSVLGRGAYLYFQTRSCMSSQATRLPLSVAVDLVQSSFSKLAPAASDHASRPNKPDGHRLVPYQPCFFSLAHMARK